MKHFWKILSPSSETLIQDIVNQVVHHEHFYEQIVENVLINQTFINSIVNEIASQETIIISIAEEILKNEVIYEKIIELITSAAISLVDPDGNSIATNEQFGIIKGQDNVQLLHGITPVLMTACFRLTKSKPKP